MYDLILYHTGSYRLKLCHVILYCYLFCYIISHIPCYLILQYIIFCYIMICRILLYDIVLCHTGISHYVKKSLGGIGTSSVPYSTYPVHTLPPHSIAIDKSKGILLLRQTGSKKTLSLYYLDLNPAQSLEPKPCNMT